MPVAPPEGRPIRVDVAFTRPKVAVFVDGCFWHACPRHGTQPTHNASYWTEKLARNVRRDRRDTQRLRAAGWRVLRFWEHDPPEDAAAQVLAELRGSGR